MVVGASASTLRAESMTDEHYPLGAHRKAQETNIRSGGSPTSPFRSQGLSEAYSEGVRATTDPSRVHVVRNAYASLDSRTRLLYQAVRQRKRASDATRPGPGNRR